MPFLRVVACPAFVLDMVAAAQAMAAACSGSLRTLDLKGLALVTDTSLVSRRGGRKNNTQGRLFISLSGGVVSHVCGRVVFSFVFTALPKVTVSALLHYLLLRNCSQSPYTARTESFTIVSTA